MRYLSFIILIGLSILAQSIYSVKKESIDSSVASVFNVFNRGSSNE